MSDVRVLACPNCGAPLSKSASELWSCMHCGALSRVASSGAPALEKKVSGDTLAQLRTLVVSGKRAEAEALCVKEGLPVSIVDDLWSSISHAILFGQKLNAFGWLIVFANFALFAGAYALIRADFQAGWVLVVFGALNLLVLLRPILTTLRMMRSPRARATIRKATNIGTKMLRRPVHLFAFEVDVDPTDGTPGFRGSLMVPVRDRSLPKASPGTAIWVRYDPDRSWLRFDSLEA